VKPSFRDILNNEAENLRKKLQAKLPEWAATEGVTIPTSLSIEQCSSSWTSRYKAEIVRGAGLLIDLTGGLGVDSWAFSRTASRVIYNERDPKLAEAARVNFEKLGRSNIEVRCGEAESFEIPDGADVIYLDPARRSATGKKVFLPEDCSPNIIALKDNLLARCPKVLVKISPMADLSLLERRFGEELSEIHVVGSAGECKEILCLLERSHSGECRTVVATEGAVIPFTRSELPPLATGRAEIGGILLEPCATLVKAGCAGLLCERFGILKLDKNTELYCKPQAPKPTATVPGALPNIPAYDSSGQQLFKSFTILDILPFNGRSISEVGKQYPMCEVTSKNALISSDDLRKKLKSRSGGDIHIFACTNLGQRILCICKK